MNQKGFLTILLIGLVIIIVVISVAGYLVINKQPRGTSKLEEKTSSIQDQNPEQLTKESLYDILAKAETIGPVQYETVGSVTITGLPQDITTEISTKVWQNLPYMKIDSRTVDITTKMIVHPDAVYFYNKSQDKYERMTTEALATSFTQKSFKELSKEIRENTTLRELGTEIFNGKLTTIVEYSIEVSGTPITVKSWIWNEKGISLKDETITKVGGLTTITKVENRNFLFGDIPDGIFEVPKDKVIESTP